MSTKNKIAAALRELRANKMNDDAVVNSAIKLADKWLSNGGLSSYSNEDCDILQMLISCTVKEKK